MPINNNFIKKRVHETEEGIKKYLTKAENRYVQPFNMAQSMYLFDSRQLRIHSVEWKDN